MRIVIEIIIDSLTFMLWVSLVMIGDEWLPHSH
jgi:hypothetical protein